MDDATDEHGRPRAIKGIKGFIGHGAARKQSKRNGPHQSRNQRYNRARKRKRRAAAANLRAAERGDDGDSDDDDNNGDGGGAGGGGGGAGGGGGGAAAAAVPLPPPLATPVAPRLVRAKTRRKTKRKEQRFAINYYFWQMLDAPPEDDWAGRDGAVARCIKGLGISKGSAGTVRDVFTLTTYAALNDEAYDPGTHTVTTARIGRPPLLATDGPEAQIVADEMEGGGSRKSATEAVND